MISAAYFPAAYFSAAYFRERPVPIQMIPGGPDQTMAMRAKQHLARKFFWKVLTNELWAVRTGPVTVSNQNRAKTECFCHFLNSKTAFREPTESGQDRNSDSYCNYFTSVTNYQWIASSFYNSDQVSLVGFTVSQQ